MVVSTEYFRYSPARMYATFVTPFSVSMSTPSPARRLLLPRFWGSRSWYATPSPPWSKYSASIRVDGTWGPLYGSDGSSVAVGVGVAIASSVRSTGMVPSFAGYCVMLKTASLYPERFATIFRIGVAVR